jgi:DNA-directed RNA polymerase subunit M
MPFCPNDKSMLLPKNGKMTCAKCGYVLGGKIESRPITTSKAETRDITVLDDAAMAKLEVNPKMKAECPNCGNNEAYYRTQQTRKSDEPETAFLRCTKCDYRWRKY